MGAIINSRLKNTSCLKQNTVLFYIAFYLMVFAKAFGWDSSNRIYFLLFVVSAALLGLRLLIMPKDWGLVVRVGALLIPSAAIFLVTRETTLLFTCLFLAASRDIDFEKAMKGALLIYLMAVPLRVLLYFLGIVEGGSKPILYYDSNDELQLAGYTYGYGYAHPNAFFAAVFIAALLLLYVRRDKLKLWELCAVSVVMTVVFRLTICKTGFLIYAVILLALAIKKWLPKKYVYLYAFAVIAGSVLIGILFPIFYTEQSPLIHFINKYLVSSRLMWAYLAIQEYGISLLGGAGVFLDILYMDTLVNSGIVGFEMVILGTGAFVWGFVRDKNTMGLICAAAMILYACMEQFPLNIAMNPFLLYAGTNVLFNRIEKRWRFHYDVQNQTFYPGS